MSKSKKNLEALDEVHGVQKLGEKKKHIKRN
jgi:hypothetical protein